MFNLRDTVRKVGRQQLWTVEVIRDTDPRYQIQLGNDFASREWANESDLELVTKQKDPESGPGFVPDKPLF